MFKSNRVIIEIMLCVGLLTIGDHVITSNAEVDLKATAVGIIESSAFGKNMEWSLDDEGTLTIDGTGAMKFSVNGTFTTTNVPWYNEREKIKSVIIKNGITNIGCYAFGYCENLATVDIPDSVTTIERLAFYNCTNLTSITIPDTVTTIEKYSFIGCANLNSITIPYSVTEVDEAAFSDCVNLSTVKILNPECGIYDSHRTFCNEADGGGNAYFTGTIYGYAGSSAERYAQRYNRKFEIIGSQPVVTPYSMGDPNGDGIINARDATMVLIVAAKSGTGTGNTLTDKQFIAADVNRDNIVNSKDATLILRYTVAAGVGQDITIEEMA
ncbi:MAG: leucine-rich repeat protein [Oscillospiraceae bacterium]|nr:leucine-rich repeat protein [Oscillospiraceae bacterium]